VLDLTAHVCQNGRDFATKVLQRAIDHSAHSGVHLHRIEHSPLNDSTLDVVSLLSLGLTRRDERMSLNDDTVPIEKGHTPVFPLRFPALVSVQRLQNVEVG
jgi:hypothetical protein